jgi:DNA-binding response OmpR family regulator
MNSNKILIIEDELKVASFIKQGLDENGFECDIAMNGEDGKNLALKKYHPIIILDINLPLISGFELCKLIRDSGGTQAILMLTAFDSTDDKVKGFENGADDYLVKPFEFRELLARIRALSKRNTFDNSQLRLLKTEDLEMNLDTKIVKRQGNKIELTAKEFSLLEYFLRNPNRVISRSEIAEKIWDITFDTGTNVIDVYINFLRKKIDKDYDKKLIHTQIGMGYVLKSE